MLHAAGRWIWNQLQGTSKESAIAPGKALNPLETWTDHDLVRAASEGGDALAAVPLEMMRGLKNSLDGGHKSAAVLAQRIDGGTEVSNAVNTLMNMNEVDILGSADVEPFPSTYCWRPWDVGTKLVVRFPPS